MKICGVVRTIFWVVMGCWSQPQQPEEVPKSCWSTVKTSYIFLIKRNHFQTFFQKKKFLEITFIEYFSQCDYCYFSLKLVISKSKNASQISSLLSVFHSVVAELWYPASTCKLFLRCFELESEGKKIKMSCLQKKKKRSREKIIEEYDKKPGYIFPNRFFKAYENHGRRPQTSVQCLNSPLSCVSSGCFCSQTGF